MNLFHLKEKSLLKAIKESNINQIQALVMDNEVDINYQDKNKTVPLIEAVRRNNVEAVKIILQKSPQLELKDLFNATALMIAVMEKNYEITKILIEAGSDVNAQDNYGETSLLIALEESDYPVANLLIEAGANVNAKEEADGYTPLMMEMLFSEDFILAPKLVSLGANVNERDSDNEPLIQLLAQQAAINQIQFLINHGAKIEDINIDDIEDEEFKEEVRNFINNGIQMNVLSNTISKPNSNNSNDIFGNTNSFF
jgi:uncharacterized protein